MNSIDKSLFGDKYLSEDSIPIEIKSKKARIRSNHGVQNLRLAKQEAEKEKNKKKRTWSTAQP